MNENKQEHEIDPFTGLPVVKTQYKKIFRHAPGTFTANQSKPMTVDKPIKPLIRNVQKISK